MPPLVRASVCASLMLAHSSVACFLRTSKVCVGTLIYRKRVWARACLARPKRDQRYRRSVAVLGLETSSVSRRAEPEPGEGLARGLVRHSIFSCAQSYALNLLMRSVLAAASPRCRARYP